MSFSFIMSRIFRLVVASITGEPVRSWLELCRVTSSSWMCSYMVSVRDSTSAIQSRTEFRFSSSTVFRISTVILKLVQAKKHSASIMTAHSSAMVCFHQDFCIPAPPWFRFFSIIPASPGKNNVHPGKSPKKAKLAASPERQGNQPQLEGNY